MLGGADQNIALPSSEQRVSGKVPPDVTEYAETRWRASSDVGLTGFVTSHGHFLWRFIPFGLRNAHATFSRLVTKVFKGLEEFCEAYLDDIMVFSRS